MIGNNLNKKEMLWQSDLGNGTFRNPVLYADYSDPDVIRVGDTYYMTASSFNYTPGLPILISKDLINWQLVNYAVKNLPYEVYNKPAHAKGIWAPSIRYHNGFFWIVVGMPDEGIFMTKTADPLGEWSPLICIWEGKGFIDPCPIWDEDGKVYIIHAYAKSRIGINSIIGMFEVNAECTRCIGEDQSVFDGRVTQPTIEGPKIYKRDGNYYIFAPAGGVTNGWQTVLRSTSIFGPYEEKIVMHQGNSPINGPHQGGLVDTIGGEEWFLHFQDRYVYGRIVHLQPVKWINGWPVIGVDKEGQGIGEPMETYKKPDGIANSMLCEPGNSDNFDSENLALQWQWLANHKDYFYSLKEKKNSLCLYPINTTKEDKVLLWNSPNVLTQKITCPEFIAETKIDIAQLPVGGKTGMIMIGGQYASLYVERQEYGVKFFYLESYGEGETRCEQVITEYEYVDQESFTLKITFNQDGYCEFSFCDQKEIFSEPTRRFSPKGAVWVGAKIGIYAVSNEDTEPKGKVFFDYFKVTALPTTGTEGR